MKSNPLALSASLLTERWRAFNRRTLRLTKRTVYGFGKNVLTYLMLLALSGIFLAPFIYMFGGSLMSAKDLADINVKWIPTRPIFDNYRFAYMLMNYLSRFLFSMGITAVAVAGQLFSCALVGYGLARLRFRLNNFVFFLVLFSLIIPPQTIIVSQYLMHSKLGTVHTWLPVLIPCFLGLGLNGGLFVFLYRQHFRGMPGELENAAMVDGLGYFGTFFRIMLPSSSSVMLVTAVLSLIWHWNDYFEPSIYINSVNRYTLTMMLRTSVFLKAVEIGVSFNGGIALAAAVLASLPVIVLFFVLQKRFIKGIENTGLAN